MKSGIGKEHWFVRHHRCCPFFVIFVFLVAILAQVFFFRWPNLVAGARTIR